MHFRWCRDTQVGCGRQVSLSVRPGCGADAGLCAELAGGHAGSGDLPPQVTLSVQRAVAGVPHHGYERASRADRVVVSAGHFGCQCLAGLAGPHYAGFVGEDDDLHPVAQSELGQDAGDVAFHGGIA